MTTLHFMPSPGLRVVDPATRQATPLQGVHVDEDSPHVTYWMRRLGQGDVSLHQAAPDKVQAKFAHTPTAIRSKP